MQYYSLTLVRVYIHISNAYLNTYIIQKKTIQGVDVCLFFTLYLLRSFCIAGTLQMQVMRELHPGRGVFIVMIGSGWRLSIHT